MNFEDKNQLIAHLDYEIQQNNTLHSRSIWSPWIFITTFSTLIWLLLDVLEPFTFGIEFIGSYIVLGETLVFLLFSIEILLNSNTESTLETAKPRFFRTDHLLTASRPILLLVLILSLTIIYCMFRSISFFPTGLTGLSFLFEILFSLVLLTLLIMSYFDFPLSRIKSRKKTKVADIFANLILFLICSSFSYMLFDFVIIKSNLSLDITIKLRLLGIVFGLLFLQKKLVDLPMDRDVALKKLIEVRRYLSLDQMELKDAAQFLELITLGSKLDSYIGESFVTLTNTVSSMMIKCSNIEKASDLIQEKINSEGVNTDSSRIFIGNELEKMESEVTSIRQNFKQIVHLQKKIKNKLKLISIFYKNSKDELESTSRNLDESIKKLEPSLVSAIEKVRDARLAINPNS